MDDLINKDIFISYKNDGSGNQFANRLVLDLENAGYSVSFTPNEARAHSFPERIIHAVENCKDFILILSAGCMEQLMRNNTVDWVREEILTAHRCRKNIIPILMEGVEIPRDAADMPECLRFLPHIDALAFPEQYLVSPFSVLTGVLKSSKNRLERYKDAFNCNPEYRVEEDFAQKLAAAEAGDVKAMYDIGMMYFYGATNSEGTASDWDFEQAAYWLKKVSESDDELHYHADNVIARMYYQGSMPKEPQSYEKAFQYHKAAAPKNAQSASTQLFMMRIGTGCKFNFNEILQLYQEKTQRGDDFSIAELAAFFVKYGRFAEAMEVYESLTELSPEANYQVGLLYRDGVTTDPPKPDYIQAAYYFRNAADNGHMQAAYEYGKMCLRPSGRFRKDFRNAEIYLKLAADNGIADAQYLLGFMYEVGHITRSLPLAVEYLEKAKNQSHSYAALDLSRIYQQSECRNYQRAFECARTAASHGIAEGELIYANLLFWGRGCQADMNKAYEMYTRAYEHGAYYAKIMMEKIEKLQESRHHT